MNAQSPSADAVSAAEARSRAADAPPVADALANLDGIACVTAPNPSPMTAEGTNTWLIGHDDLVVIDPGPDDARHLAALIARIGGRPVRSIIVTHSHVDHSALAPALAQAVGAPVMAFGPTGSGMSARMAALDLPAFGEGADDGFAPDITLPDGAVIDTGVGPLQVLHTPGHFGNHICLARGGILFSGDHVMGWSTSIVAPPHGDMGDYMSSLHRLQAQAWRASLPGHGPAITAPAARTAELIAHRKAREAAVIAALATGPANCPTLTARAYGDLHPGLLPYAQRNCLAHLIDLTTRGLATAPARLTGDSVFALP